LARALVRLGYTVWISDHDIVLGNSLPLKINEGLKSCRFGVAVLSLSYLRKHWTMKELAALTSREETERRDIIIPVLHGINREHLTAGLPLWAPTVSEAWTGDAYTTARAIARAIGAPVVSNAQPPVAFALARALATGDLDIEPKHVALIAGVGQAVAAIGEVWSTVQSSNSDVTKGASDARKRARTLMLVGKLRGPASRLHAQTEFLESAAAEYLGTLRKLVEVAAMALGVENYTLVRLNEVYSGAVAATFSAFVSAFTAKRAQTVTYPKGHPDLTRVMDGVGADLGRLSLAFETLVEFCLSELPERVRLVLEQ
jgi:hypothetical protein